MGETADVSPATRQRTDPDDAVAVVPVTVTGVSDTKLVIHANPLFGPQIPYKKDAPFPSTGTATLLNNPSYSLRLARSVVPVPDRQYILKKNMSGHLSDLVDFSMKVLITMVTRLVLFVFSCILNIPVYR